jgi:hypothetical protein
MSGVAKAAPLLFCSLPKQFQEKWEPVFRPELRRNKALERFNGSVKI